MWKRTPFLCQCRLAGALTPRSGPAGHRLGPTGLWQGREPRAGGVPLAVFLAPPRVLLKSCGLSPDAPCPTSSFGKARGVQLHGLAVTVTELLLALSPAGLGPS